MPGAEGFDNVTLRLGTDLAVRLPRRAVAAALILGEQRWLDDLAGRLPLPVPAPLRAGSPGRGYPWAWSVVPWLEGEPADVTPPDASEAAVLGRFLAALHGPPAPPDAPANPYRGVQLAERSEALALRLDQLPIDADVDAEAVRQIYAAGMAAPVSAGGRWVHGDLHPRNVLVADGRLSAVIDWGDLTSGDPATDVAALWMLFDEPAHEAFWQAYGPIEAGLAARARAWAAMFGVMLLVVGLADDPRHAAVGRRTLGRLTDAGR